MKSPGVGVGPVDVGVGVSVGVEGGVSVGVFGLAGDGRSEAVRKIDIQASKPARRRLLCRYLLAGYRRSSDLITYVRFPVGIRESRETLDSDPI